MSDKILLQHHHGSSCAYSLRTYHRPVPLVANGTNIKGKAEDTEEATLGSSQDSTYRPGPSKGEA